MTTEEIIEHAFWVYEETCWLDSEPMETHNKAFRAAIEAALSKAHREFIEAMRDDILENAVDLEYDPENDLNEDGVASLLWYAKQMNDMLPPEQRLENDGSHR